MANNMSFLPDDYLARRKDRRTNLICMTLFVIVMGGVVGAYYVTDRKRAEIRDRHQEVSAEFQKAAERIEQVNELQKRKKEMVRKAKITAVLIERVPRSIIMAELINNMPTSLSLTELELETKIVRAQPTARTALEKAKEQAKKKALAGKDSLKEEELKVQPTVVEMRMQGLAPTDVQVAQFMTALQRSELFEDVSLIFSEHTQIEKEPMRKFRIDMVLNQEMKADDLSPKRVRRELKQNPMANTVQIDPTGQFVPPKVDEKTTASVPVDNEDR